MHSIAHGKANIEALEVAARKLLGIPRLPDGATGPRSAALLAEIRADVAKLGRDAAMRKHACYCTVANACALDSDPDEHKAASGRTIAHLEHPARKGEYAYPDSDELRAALSNSTMRARCPAQALAALDSHAANAKPLPPDWTAK